MKHSDDMKQWERRALTACWIWDSFHTLWWAVPAALAGWNAYMALSGRLQTGFAVISLVLAACMALFFHPRAQLPLPAGLLLSKDAFPDLHGEILSAARAVDAPSPESVRMLPGSDLFLIASIRHKHTRFYVGIGLLAHLTRGEFRALAAQEFARIHTPPHSAVSRVMRLRQRATAMNLPDNLMHHLYLRFLAFFLDYTHGIARRQELEADAQAARKVGGEALVSGLRRYSILRPGFDAFWNMEVVPVLDAGFKPPLVEGFSMYLQSAPVQEVIRQVTASELRRIDEDGTETPPPLSERIRAVQAYVSSGPPHDSRQLDMPLAEMEDALLAESFPMPEKPLTPISWDELLPRVLLPHYREVVAQQRGELAGIRMDELHSGARSPQNLLGRMFGSPPPVDADPQEMRMLLGSILGPVLSAILHMRGVKLECRPGEPVRALCEPVPVQPFTLFDDIHAGRLKIEEWQQVCKKYQLQERDLGELCAEFLAGESGEVSGKENLS